MIHNYLSLALAVLCANQILTKKLILARSARNFFWVLIFNEKRRGNSTARIYIKINSASAIYIKINSARCQANENFRFWQKNETTKIIWPEKITGSYLWSYFPCHWHSLKLLSPSFCLWSFSRIMIRLWKSTNEVMTLGEINVSCRWQHRDLDLASSPPLTCFSPDSN